MVTQITPKYSREINKLVRSLFCNCVHNNCLTLDDGDEHTYSQLISQSGISVGRKEKIIIEGSEREQRYELGTAVSTPAYTKFDHGVGVITAPQEYRKKRYLSSRHVLEAGVRHTSQKA